MFVQRLCAEQYCGTSLLHTHIRFSVIKELLRSSREILSLDTALRDDDLWLRSGDAVIEAMVLILLYQDPDSAYGPLPFSVMHEV